MRRTRGSESASSKQSPPAQLDMQNCSLDVWQVNNINDCHPPSTCAFASTTTPPFTHNSARQRTVLELPLGTEVEEDARKRECFFQPIVLLPTNHPGTTIIFVGQQLYMQNCSVDVWQVNNTNDCHPPSTCAFASTTTPPFTHNLARGVSRRAAVASAAALIVQLSEAGDSP
jgi:hypothetical protein